MIRCAFTLAIAVCCSGSLADARDYKMEVLPVHTNETVLIESDRIAYERQQDAYQQTFDKFAKELNAIEEWFALLGFKSPYFPDAGGGAAKLILYDLARDKRDKKNSPLKQAIGDWENNAGHYDPAEGIAINLSKVPEGDLDVDTRDTLAHELYHAVQFGSPVYDGPDWIVESMAVVVGARWVKGTPNILSSYGQTLSAPENEYGRWHFFAGLGTDLNSEDSIAYFAELNKEDPVDGARGLLWLDGFLDRRGMSLHEYFPEFIARYARTRRYFEGATVKDPIKPRVHPTGTGSAKDAEVRIDPVAGVYADATPQFVGDWDRRPDEERVFLNVISIKDPTDSEPLRLIVGQKLTDKDSNFVRPVFASKGVMEKPFEVKVTNVSLSPDESVDQRTKIELRTSQVLFRINSCLKPGETVPIQVEADVDPEDVARSFGGGPNRLQASDGQIEGLQFTAPVKPGDVEIFADLPTLDGGTKKVLVATSSVVKGGCMVQMIAGPGQITYSGEADYSEFKDTQSGQAVYLSLTDFIAYGKGQWRPIPENMKQMVLARVFKQINIGMVGPDGVRTKKGQWAGHAMPKFMAQRFSWDNLKDAMTPDGKPTERLKASCPSGVADEPCSKTLIGEEGEPVEVTFQADGMPVSVNMKGRTIRFKYGSFDIRRPPGW